MTQDEIIDMAMEAEFVSRGKPSYEESELFVCIDKDIVRFAKLVAAKEREACAKVVDARLEKWEKIIGKDKMYKWMRGLPEVIRARGEQA